MLQSHLKNFQETISRSFPMSQEMKIDTFYMSLSNNVS